MDNAAFDAEVHSLAIQLAAWERPDSGLPLSPRWIQQKLLGVATADPEFRTRLLRFVDLLPALRSSSEIADHARQYFGDDGPAFVHLGTEIASLAGAREIFDGAVHAGVRQMAGRFIAGESPEAARHRLEHLAHSGVGHTVDLLGEACLSDAEADQYVGRYFELLAMLAANAGALTPHRAVWAGQPGLNVSLKYSSFCPHFEPAAPDRVAALTLDRLRPLLRQAVRDGIFVNIDMEQHRFKDLVHRIFAAQVTSLEFAAYPHFGIVVQAYQRDALGDIAWIANLARERGTPITVRLVKGAYWDEEQLIAAQNGWRVPVYDDKAGTDESFNRCVDALLAASPWLRPAFGSHNPDSVAYALVKAKSLSFDPADIEFQVLYGMAEGLRTKLVSLGYRVRAYVPVGAIVPGMAYLVRRLLENTSNESWFNAGSGIAEREANHPAAHLPAPDQSGFVNAPPAEFHRPEVRDRLEDALRSLRGAEPGTYPLRIGGRNIADRELSPVRYPADPDRIIGNVAQATLADADDAVAAAVKVQPAWRDIEVAGRAAILQRAATLMEERRFDLAALMILESGKPWREADGDVAEAIDYLRYYADLAGRTLTPRPVADIPGERNTLRYDPLGIAAIISPWNFPLAIVTGMTVGALVAGNAAIVKPAEQSPLIAAHLVDLLLEAGVPSGVVQFLPGEGERIGKALVDHAGVDLIAFTGSSAVGQEIMKAGIQPRSNGRGFKKVIAEMGGKNPLIVDEDADLDQAIAGTITSAFGYAGQKCSACSRLIVVGSAYRDTLQRLAQAVDSLIVGPPDDPLTFVPPVIGAEARDRILRYVAMGKAEGTVLAERRAPESVGYYVSPIVFTDLGLDSPPAREEIFGPVLTVFKAANFGEAIALANYSPYALTAGVFSRNPANIERAERELRAGNIYINRAITGAIVGRQPFGGRGLSGVGEKAGGPDYLRQFVEARIVTENTVRRGFAGD